MSGRVVLVVEQLRRTVPGGIGTYTEGLLDALGASSAEGLEVTLYASRAPAGIDPLVRFGFPLRTSPLPGPLLTRAFGAGVARFTRRAGVVHATSLAAPGAGGPLVVTVYDLAWRHVPEAYPRHGRAWHEAALRRAVRRKAHFVVPSTAARDELAGAGLRIASERITLIEPGADHLPGPDAAGADALLAGLGVAGEFLLTVSTLEPRKNLARLFAAYARALPELPEAWPLVVVGPSGWGEAIGDVPAGVRLAGKVPPAVLAALYARARLVAFVPLVEGYGLPVVEAMRAGTPVVASPVPASAGAALEVDPLDVDAIAGGLIAAATDTLARTELIEAGRARALPLTWEATARAHCALWRSL